MPDENSTANFNDPGTEQVADSSVPKTEKKDWIAEAILWYATPKALRDPRSATKFCQLHGVPRSTFDYEFNKKERQQEIENLCFRLAKSWTPDVLEKLKKKIDAEDTKSIEMYFDLSKESRIAYIAPTIQQARDIAWSIMLKEFKPIIVKAVESPSREITVKNLMGTTSLIQLRGWEAIQIQGDSLAVRSG